MNLIKITIFLRGLHFGDQVRMHVFLCSLSQRSLVAKVQRRQLPDIGMLFLNLTVRRSNLVADSLNEVNLKLTLEMFASW